jgi:hypothetical protein
MIRRLSMRSNLGRALAASYAVQCITTTNGFTLPVPPKAKAATLTAPPSSLQVRAQPRSLLYASVEALDEYLGDQETATTTAPTTASKREMLGFAIPALGIYLTNPLMSNIDNAFVGRTVGTAGLAALSPATICTDQMLYLFSFLGRATTGIVARVYAARDGDGKGNTEAARDAASARTCGPLFSFFFCMESFLNILFFFVFPLT